MLTDKKISIIVICYNDAGSIREMYRRVTEVMKHITPNYEIIYVNDASPDNAIEILRDVAKRDKKFTVLSHSRNFGGQIAYSTGLKYCTGDAAILLDGDIQDPPELFPEFVKKFLGGYEIIYGERIKRRGSKVWNKFYKLFYRLFKRLAYINVPLDAGDFGLMSRKVIDIINKMPEQERYIRGLRAWVGFKTLGIPYTRSERFSGETNNSFLWSIIYAKRLILSFSNRPLEWISYLAFFVVILSGVGLVIYLALYFILPDAPRGIPTIITLILFLGGIQLFSLSVIGEYVGKIFEEVKGRPVGLVQEAINYTGKKEINS
ncbi:glycosyltransferase [archaeon]|nr:glycosyltransferase [archaeon]